MSSNNYIKIFIFFVFSSLIVFGSILYLTQSKEIKEDFLVINPSVLPVAQVETKQIPTPAASMRTGVKIKNSSASPVSADKRNQPADLILPSGSMSLEKKQLSSRNLGSYQNDRAIHGRVSSNNNELTASSHWISPLNSMITKKSSKSDSQNPKHYTDLNPENNHIVSLAESYSGMNSMVDNSDFGTLLVNEISSFGAYALFDSDNPRENGESGIGTTVPLGDGIIFLLILSLLYLSIKISPLRKN